MSHSHWGQVAHAARAVVKDQSTWPPARSRLSPRTSEQGDEPRQLAVVGRPSCNLRSLLLRRETTASATQECYLDRRRRCRGVACPAQRLVSTGQSCVTAGIKPATSQVIALSTDNFGRGRLWWRTLRWISLQRTATTTYAQTGVYSSSANDERSVNTPQVLLSQHCVIFWQRSVLAVNRRSVRKHPKLLGINRRMIEVAIDGALTNEPNTNPKPKPNPNTNRNSNPIP